MGTESLLITSFAAECSRVALSVRNQVDTDGVDNGGDHLKELRAVLGLLICQGRNLLVSYMVMSDLAEPEAFWCATGCVAFSGKRKVK